MVRGLIALWSPKCSHMHCFFPKCIYTVKPGERKTNPLNQAKKAAGGLLDFFFDTKPQGHWFQLKLFLNLISIFQKFRASFLAEFLSQRVVALQGCHNCRCGSSIKGSYFGRESRDFQGHKDTHRGRKNLSFLQRKYLGIFLFNALCQMGGRGLQVLAFGYSLSIFLASLSS